ncbi:hypothetical protein KK475_29020, partial [Klebsiella pneumoniae]|uniref:AMP-binding enzyme n=1 Tax=Klebsiella pneumoniae TaxID=573 RepID=UPI0039049A0F|nr:hypothetical protein [Klebsiella pneumoniae]
PAELEAILLEHPDIADVAVVGIAIHDNDEERPRAYVVLKQSAKQEGQTRGSEEDIKQFLEGRVAKFQRLEGGVKFLISIP